MEPIKVRMLGNFSLECNAGRISDSEDRSRKIWLLLAYLIYHRQTSPSEEELIEFLWGDSPRGANPTGALKTSFHRVRTLLDRLFPSAGRKLIVRKDGSYTWNEAVPVLLDLDQFEALCTAECDDPEEQLRIFLDALDLYQGDFLSRLSPDPWAASVSDRLHTLYLEVLLKVLPLLMERGRLDEAASLCETASHLEPHHKTIHLIWMRALLGMGEQDAAAAVYTAFRDRLFSGLGITPPEELRTLYREATRTPNQRLMTMESILEQLTESPSSSGALMCEYDFFIVLCRSVARSMARTGTVTHIALLTALDENGGELSKRALPRIMDNLGEQIRTSLRKGDAAARCGGSQYILMLPQANYENSCKVCTRIIKAFARKYPHSPAKPQYTVYPLEPNF